MQETGWEEKGPKLHSKNSGFGTPMILVLFSGLPIFADPENVSRIWLLKND